MKELRDAIPPFADTELKRDLWPQMQRRLEVRTIRITAFDWGLIAAVIAWLAMFPEAALTVLYHL